MNTNNPDSPENREGRRTGATANEPMPDTMPFNRLERAGVGTSPEARQFLEQNLPVEPDRAPPRKNIETLRQETREACQPAIDQALERFRPVIDSREIGGVRCLSISPPGAGKTPGDTLLLYFFGGGYIQGSPEEDLPITAVLSHRLNLTVISPDYRLAPENPYPAAIEDGRMVCREILGKMNIRNLLLVGESAGGNLALQTLLWVRRQNLAMPRACALLSPWVDLTNQGDSFDFNNGRDPTLLTAYAETAAELFAGKLPVDHSGLSPLHGQYDESFPPMMVTSGTRDLLLSTCVQLVARLRASGIQVDFRVWENMWHVFEYYPQIPEAGQSLAEICQFLARHSNGECKAR
ncbi:MAG: alpha/beta hydrolase [Gammaproteobacteria bacterium]|nr:alpha/beta hydrolase [Gammaproteobacteria bacterium]